jgi:hypothetical protein
MRADAIAPYAPAIIRLLQGVVYHDDAPTWDLLLNYRSPIQEHFGTFGVEVYVNEADGFAFLRQPEIEADDGRRVALPRITRRDRLNYHVTLLCVLLREQLDQFDATQPDSDRLIVSLDLLRDLSRPFYRERSDERALLRSINTAIERTVDLGFLRRLAGADERFEVRRILKARIDAERIAEIKEKLQHYAPTDE